MNFSQISNGKIIKKFSNEDNIEYNIEKDKSKIKKDNSSREANKNSELKSHLSRWNEDILLRIKKEENPTIENQSENTIH